MDKLAIIGAGSWGTALSIVLAPRFDCVTLWAHEPELSSAMRATRENAVYLPGCALPGNVDPCSDAERAVRDAGLVLGVVPSKHARRTYERFRPFLDPRAPVVSATKGIESGSLLRMSQVIQEALRPRFEARVAVLSGPSFAKEVAGGAPAAVVIAAEDDGLGRSVQGALAGPRFRLYRNADMIGVEVGAALKNVIAIASGVCEGLHLGHNTLAALVTRGLAEITRLAVAMGGNAKTLAGLAGLGDLVLTCTGNLSRNRRVGIELASGRSLSEIVSSMTMVAEGVETAAAAMALARKHGVDLPIICQMQAVLEGKCSPQDALRELMERSLKDE